MSKFKLIGEFNAAPVLKELQNCTFWNWLNLRKAEGLNHKSVDDIVLRFQTIQGLHSRAFYFDEMECVDYFPQYYLPNTMKAVKEFAEDRDIGRILVAKLKPSSEIAKHIDEGLYCLNHDRFHMVVKTNFSVCFECEGIYQHMQEGEIWWFDNKAQHSVVNAGDSSRIHLIVDIKK